MPTKVIIAGVVGGVALFVWGFLTHMVIPLGDVGISYLPKEQQDKVFEVTKAEIKEPGLYFMPGYDRSLKGEELETELNSWIEEFKQGPTALLIYNPTGETPMSTADLGIQFLCDLVVGLICALIVYSVCGLSFGKKVGIVALLGVLAFLETDAANCNWYRFPLDYTCAQFIDKIGGMLVVGTVLATMIKRRSQEEANQE